MELSKKEAKKAIIKEGIPEIIGKKKNSLLKNPYFLGFYIKRKIPKDILKIIKNKYPNKIIFWWEENKINTELEIWRKEDEITNKN